MPRSVPPALQAVTGNLPALPATLAGIDVRDAAYHTAHQFGGGVPAMALRMGLNPNTLAHKVSLQKDSHHLSLVEAVAMQEVSGDYRILHAMAAALGHLCISLHVASGATTMQDVARLAQEFGETLTAITQSVADGIVTPNEMQHCECQAAELQAAINAALCTLRGMMPRMAGGAA